MAKLSGRMVWHGRPEDVASLVAAVGGHCTCTYRATLCVPHQMLADQCMLDRLAFARTVARRRVSEEWRVSRWDNRLKAAFVASLLVLALLLSVGAGAYPFRVPAGQQIASWQTR